MARIQSDYNYFVDASDAGNTLNTGAGKIFCIVATADSTTPQLITLYDNTAASGNILLKLYVVQTAPLVIIYPSTRPPKFTTGLTVVTTANVRAHFVLEV